MSTITRAGIRIGCAYVPQQRCVMSNDALVLQAALLRPSQPVMSASLRRLARRVWRWL